MGYRLRNSALLIYIFLLVLLCVVQPAVAQTDSEKEAQDTEEVMAPDESYSDYADTVLKRNFINYQKDSLLKLKKSRDFFYMAYLDSLLRSRKDIKSDTVNLDQVTGKVTRKKVSDYSGINQILNSLPVKIFFWLLAISFIGFVFYKLFYNNGIFDAFRNKKREIEVPDDIREGLEEFSSYDGLINAAETSQDFNLATRYFYLQTLKILSDKGLIEFAPDKTNDRYVFEMRSNQYCNQFESLTRNYEYVWYGKFVFDRLRYNKLKAAFIDFNKKVSVI